MIICSEETPFSFVLKLPTCLDRRRGLLPMKVSRRIISAWLWDFPSDFLFAKRTS